VLGQALGRLFAVAEDYPELKADANFRQLQDELSETENRVAVSRQIYNDATLTFNNSIQVFPGVLLAGPFNFTAREYFENDATERGAPDVQF
jgi:LemA protein